MAGLLTIKIAWQNYRPYSLGTIKRTERVRSAHTVAVKLSITHHTEHDACINCAYHAPLQKVRCCLDYLRAPMKKSVVAHIYDCCTCEEVSCCSHI